MRTQYIAYRAAAHLRDAIALMEPVTTSRAISVARTNAETALMWVERETVDEPEPSNVWADGDQ